MYRFGKLRNISTLCHIWSYTCTFLLLGFWPVAIDLLSEAVIIDIPWGFQHCRSHGCSGDNQFDSEAAGPLKRPSSWGIVAMVAGFCQDAEGEWHNVYGVVDDISWRWLRYFHIAPFGIHLGFAWDWKILNVAEDLGSQVPICGLKVVWRAKNSGQLRSFLLRSCTAEVLSGLGDLEAGLKWFECCESLYK